MKRIEEDEVREDRIVNEIIVGAYGLEEQAMRLLGSLGADVVPDTPQRSILELKGLGREIWQNVDVEKHIQEERASWDG